MVAYRIPHDNYEWLRRIRAAYGPNHQGHQEWVHIRELQFLEGSHPFEQYNDTFATQSSRAVRRSEVRAFLNQIDTVKVNCVSAQGLRGAFHWATASQLTSFRITISPGVGLGDVQGVLQHLPTQISHTLRDLQVYLDHRVLTVLELDAMARTLSELCPNIPYLSSMVSPIDIFATAWSRGYLLSRVQPLQSLTLSRSICSQEHVIQPAFHTLDLPSLQVIYITAPFAQCAGILVHIPRIHTLSIRCDSPDGMTHALQSIAHACRGLKSITLDVRGERNQRRQVDWTPLLQCDSLTSFSITYPHTLPFDPDHLSAMLARWRHIGHLSLNPSPRNYGTAPALPLSSLLAIAQSGPLVQNFEAFMTFNQLSELNHFFDAPSYGSVLVLNLGWTTGRNQDVLNVAAALVRLFPYVRVVASTQCSHWVQTLSAAVQALQAA